MKRILLVSLLLPFFYSCASTGFLMAKAKVTMYQDAYPPRDGNAPIDIFQSKTPDSKYIEIAEISCADTNSNWALEQILIKARQIGAEGIIVLGKAGSYGAGVPIGDMVYTSSPDYGINAIAIKYKEE